MRPLTRKCTPLCQNASPCHKKCVPLCENAPPRAKVCPPCHKKCVPFFEKMHPPCEKHGFNNQENAYPGGAFVSLLWLFAIEERLF